MAEFKRKNKTDNTDDTNIIDEEQYELTHEEEVLQPSESIEIKESYKILLNEVGELLTRKNKDYGNSFEKSIDKWGLCSYLIRVEDKMNRLENLVKTEKQYVSDESIRDTLLDILGYSLLAVEKLDKTSNTPN